MAKKRIKLPRKIENGILYESARTCCVCRTPKSPIQIHHIDENPSNNCEDNLVVLCKICHDEAHTKHELSKNLTPDKLIYSKRAWNNEVQNKSSKAMLPSSNLSQAMWTFVNHQRVPDIMNFFGINFSPYLYNLLQEDGVIDKLGIPRLPKKEIQKKHITLYDYFPYDSSQRLHYLYRQAIDDLIVKANPIEIGAIWSKNEIIDIVSPGDIIFCIKGFYFKRSEIINGEEDRFVHTHSKGIEIKFLANTRHMYGTSALYNSFSGQRFVATLLLVKNLERNNGKLTIDCTPLALGYGFVSYEYHSPYDLKYGWQTFGRRIGPVVQSELDLDNPFD